MAIKVIAPAGGGGSTAISGSIWDLRISGNTLGTTALVSSGTLSLNAGTNITLSQSATNKITILGPTNIISAAVIGGNTSGVTASVSSGTLNLMGGTNITLSQNAQSVSIVGPANVVSAAVIGGNTSGATASISSGTMVLAGGTNITLSQAANAITIMGANTGTNLIWEAVGGGQLSQRQFGQSSVHVDPVYANGYFSFTNAAVMFQASLSTSSNSSVGGTLSWDVGIYSLNVSTLSLMTSGQTNVPFSNTSNNSSASIQGFKWITIPFSGSITPGYYWLAHLTQTATANTNWVSLSNLMVGAYSNSGSFAGASSGTFNWVFGGGHWSVVSAALPNSMALTDLRNNQPADIGKQFVVLHGTTA